MGGRKKIKPGDTILASNRKARHDYEILETFEAGLMLHGTEVKAARQGLVQLRDSYVELKGGEAWLVKAHISPYDHGNRENHEIERRRKLLLNRREIDRLSGRVQLRGLTVIPLDLHLKEGWIKATLALAKGRTGVDKRHADRERELDKEVREATSMIRR